MHYYVYEPALPGHYPARITAEVEAFPEDPNETEEMRRQGSANHFVGKDSRVMTEEELLADREGRRALAAWRAKDTTATDAFFRWLRWEVEEQEKIAKATGVWGSAAKPHLRPVDP